MIWLICNVIGHPDDDGTLGYDPVAAFSWRDKAVKWAEDEVRERLVGNGRQIIQMTWELDRENSPISDEEDGRPLVLYVRLGSDNYDRVEYALVSMAIETGRVE